MSNISISRAVAFIFACAVLLVAGIANAADATIPAKQKSFTRIGQHCTVAECKSECTDSHQCIDFCGPSSCTGGSGTCSRRDTLIRQCARQCGIHPICQDQRSR